MGEKPWITDPGNYLTGLFLMFLLIHEDSDSRIALAGSFTIISSPPAGLGLASRGKGGQSPRTYRRRARGHPRDGVLNAIVHDSF